MAAASYTLGIALAACRPSPVPASLCADIFCKSITFISRRVLAGARRPVRNQCAPFVCAADGAACDKYHRSPERKSRKTPKVVCTV